MRYLWVGGGGGGCYSCGLFLWSLGVKMVVLICVRGTSPYFWVAALAYSIVLSTKIVTSVLVLVRCDNYVERGMGLRWRAVLCWTLGGKPCHSLRVEHSCNSQMATANEAINAGGCGRFSVCVVGVEKEKSGSGTSSSLQITARLAGRLKLSALWGPRFREPRRRWEPKLDLR